MAVDVEDDEDETAILFVNGKDTTFNGDGYASMFSTDMEDDEGEELRCITIDDAIESAGFGRFQVLMLLVFGLAHAADAVQTMSISYVLPQASCELEATDLELGLLTAMGFAGMMFGAYIWGSFADARGRIPALILCQACNGLFIVGSSVSQSLWFLILMRFLSGLGEGGTVPLVYTYVIELLPVKRRARMTAILSSTYMIGQTGIAGLAWLVLPHTEWTWRISNFTFNYWRIFLLISSVPIILSLFLFMLFPESPRYLVQVNKIAQAKSVIRYMFRKNQPKKAYDSTYTIQCEVEGESTNSRCCASVKQVAKNTLHLVKSPELRFKFLLSSTILFCLSFSYYGLTMWFPTMIQRMDESKATSVCAVTSLTSNKTLCDFSDETKVYFDTFLQAAANLPGHLIYFLLVNSVGRKPIIGVSMVLTAVSVFFIWFVSSPTGSIVMSCVFAGVTIVTWDAIALVTVEMFPSKVRSTARGVQNALALRVPAVLANITMGALLSTHCAVPILLIAGLLAASAVLTYKLPDTTNMPIN